MPEEIITPTIKPISDEEKRLTLDIYIKHIDMLERIRIWYRSPSIAHTIRLMIEDVDKSIENGIYMKMGL